MTARNLRPFALLLLALAVVACDKGRQQPLKTQVRVINVAPTFESLDFRREQTEPLTVAFKGSFDPQSYDEDTYDFFIGGRVGSQQQVVHTFAQTIANGTTYAFVLYALGETVGSNVLEYPTLPSGATDSQIVAFHAGEGLPAVDMHIAPAGTNVNGAVPWGTLSFLQTLAPRRLPAGVYEITLTAAGDPNNVLLTSLPFELVAGRSSVFVVTPEAGQTSEPMSVVFVQDTPAGLLDRDTVASLRVLNAATDRAPRDFAVASQFSPPLFSSVPFATPTAYGPAPVGSTTFNATPPGNPGVLELNMEIATGRGVQFTAFVTGSAGVLTAMLTPDDNRRIPTVSKLRFYNAVQQFAGGIIVYVEIPGTDVATVLPRAVLLPGVSGSYLPFTAGEYEITLANALTGAIISGPLRVTLDSGGLYGALAIDGTVTGTAEIVLLDDFL